MQTPDGEFFRAVASERKSQDTGNEVKKILC